MATDSTRGSLPWERGMKPVGAGWWSAVRRISQLTRLIPKVTNSTRVMIDVAGLTDTSAAIYQRNALIRLGVVTGSGRGT